METQQLTENFFQERQQNEVDDCERAAAWGSDGTADRQQLQRIRRARSSAALIRRFQCV